MLLLSAALPTIATATTMPQLWRCIGGLVAIGLGMACVDSGAMPQLAGRVEAKHGSESFGSAFALADMALSLGYLSGPAASAALQRALGGLLHAWMAYGAGLAALSVFIVLMSAICGRNGPVASPAGFRGSVLAGTFRYSSASEEGHEERGDTNIDVGEAGEAADEAGRLLV
jgi:MFS family permease